MAKKVFIESSKYDIEFENITLKNWPFLKEKIEFQFKNLNFLTIQSLPVFTVIILDWYLFYQIKSFLINLGLSSILSLKYHYKKKIFLNIN